MEREWQDEALAGFMAEYRIGPTEHPLDYLERLCLMAKVMLKPQRLVGVSAKALRDPIRRDAKGKIVGGEA